MTETREMFARVGLRCTRQREVLYEALCECRSHPTADELFHLAATRGGLEPGELSLATVYNTLDALVEAGLCRRVPCPSGAARFDGEMHEHIHVLTADNRVVDLPDDLGRKVLSAITADLVRDIEGRLSVGLATILIQVGPPPAPGPVTRA